MSRLFPVTSTITLLYGWSYADGRELVHSNLRCDVMKKQVVAKLVTAPRTAIKKLIIVHEAVGNIREYPPM